MENNAWKNYSGLASRILAGGIIAAAGTYHFLASHEMLVWLLSGLGMPSFLCGAAAYILPYAEVLLGLFLAAGLFMPYPAVICAGGLAITEIIFLLAWLMGLPAASEPYFGPAMSRSLAFEIFHNVLLILLIYPAAMFGRELSLDFFIKKSLPEKIK